MRKGTQIMLGLEHSDDRFGINEGQWFRASEIINGNDFNGSCIYIIWEDWIQERPLYIGMTTKGTKRVLEHLNNHSSSLVLKKTVSLSEINDWLILTIPIQLNNTPHQSHHAVLHRFERFCVRTLNPWIWHGGLRNVPTDKNQCPKAIRNYLVWQTERRQIAELRIGIMHREEAAKRVEWLKSRIG